MSKYIYEHVQGELPDSLKNRVYGLELELEQVADSNPMKIVNLARLENDNSLRCNGREFISQPIPFDQALSFYQAVMNGPNVLWMDKNLRCTERCSTHVHVNVSNLTFDEVRLILRLYCMLEPGFFNQVEDHRKNNIYCVPLSSTKLPDIIHHADLFVIAERWHKYTAFNAKPLFSLGTLEFRHFQATESFADFTRWLTCLDTFFTVCGELRDLDFSFEVLLTMYIRIFRSVPDAATKEHLLLTYQEDLVNRVMFSTKTLTTRIKEFKKGTPACAV